MAQGDYDEDLETNPFFVSIRRDFSDLFQKALAEGFLLAIPRRGSLKGVETFQRDEVVRHVLVASEDFSLTRFHTLDGAEVLINGDTVTLVTGPEQEDRISTRILFNETFYDEDINKVQLWCVSDPLANFQAQTSSEYEDHKPAATSLLPPAPSVSECVEFLKKFVGGQPLLVKIEQLAQDLEKSLNAEPKLSLSNYDLLVSGDQSRVLDTLVTETGLAYKSAVACALAFPHVRMNPSWHPTVGLAVEQYFLHCVHRQLFDQVALIFAQDDSILNRLLRHASLSGVDPVSLGVRSEFMSVIPRARKELLRLVDVATTPRSKLECLNRSMSAILTETEASEFAVSADDLLPIMIYILTKTCVPNWFAHLHLMADFQLAKQNNFDPQPNSDKSSFQLATLEAALEHIKSGGIGNQNLIVQSRSRVQPVSPQSPTSIISLGLRILFESIEKNDVETAKKILESSFDLLPVPEMLFDSKCHPLCTCTKCSKAKTAPCSINISASVSECDERGWTSLHLAACLGRPLLIELLLAYDRSAVDFSNADGQTALHLAAHFGQQNALLLLLHASADFNLTDKTGNTPLILASGNGNISCVKALLYYAEHQSKDLLLDAENHFGETALHLASRWGFLDVVRILIDHGANVNTRNKRRESPLVAAHNLYMAQILKNASTTSQASTNQQSTSNPNFSKAETSEELQKLKRLFKAIKVGDIPLAAFYLGIEKSLCHDQSHQVETDCHPFCDCVKCFGPGSHDQPLLPHLARQGKVSISTRKSKNKLSVNAKDSNGVTPLHVAASSGYLPAAVLLLRAGAVPSPDARGQTPLHTACSNGHLLIADAITARFSESVNNQDNRGVTPLHVSIASCNYEIVNLLLNRGALTDIKNKSGHSPYEDAALRKDVAILDLFNKHKIKQNPEDKEIS